MFPTLSAYPMSAIVKLIPIMADGSRSPEGCTAQMVGPDLAMTASHCIDDIELKQAAVGYAIETNFDVSLDPVKRTAARVIAMAYPAGLMTQRRQVVEQGGCNDWVLLRLDKRLGDSTGWFGIALNSEVTPPSQSRPADTPLLYRLSYPMVRSSAKFAEMIGSLEKQFPDPVQRAAVEKQLQGEVKRAELEEMDFKPGSLYFQYGMASTVASDHYRVAGPSSPPGTSGSALFDRDFNIHALTSSGYNGGSYFCRIKTADWNGAAAAMGLR